jgi:ribosome-interacting GTPase 1
MSKLTGTHSEVSEIDFTTLTTVPGTVKVHGAPIQILDLRTSPTTSCHTASLILPFSAGIIEGANDGRGRGRQGSSNVCGELEPLPNRTPQSSPVRTSVTRLPRQVKAKRYSPFTPVARTCNLIFIVLDVLKPLGDKKLIETELEGFGIRLNKRPPAILVRRKEKGGIAITNTVPLTNIDQDEIKAILSEYKINNADIAIREPGATADDLVDVIEGNRSVWVLSTEPLLMRIFSESIFQHYMYAFCISVMLRVIF